MKENALRFQTTSNNARVLVSVVFLNVSPIKLLIEDLLDYCFDSLEASTTAFSLQLLACWHKRTWIIQALWPPAIFPAFDMLADFKNKLTSAFLREWRSLKELASIWGILYLSRNGPDSHVKKSMTE